MYDTEFLFNSLSSNVKDFDSLADNIVIDRKGVDNAILESFFNKIKGVCWVMPIRKLCLRYINETNTINDLHSHFLNLAIN